jgi:hypothetical protein
MPRNLALYTLEVRSELAETAIFGKKFSLKNQYVESFANIGLS